MGVRRLCTVVGAPAAEAFVAVAPLPFDGVCDALQLRGACVPESQRVPFILSRLAASAALSALLGSPVSFAGGRLDALQHGAHLSLSHEDRVGLAVAWRAGAPVAVGVDVVDVAAVARLAQRFPHFALRMLPHCAAAVSSSSSSFSSSSFSSSSFSSLSPAEAARLSGAYGADAAAVVMAQHWGLRECCVKLVGAPGRGFAMRCVERPAAALPAAGEAFVIGEEREAMRAAGLSHRLRVTTAPLAVELEGKERKAYAVVIAACERERGVPS